MPVAMRYRKNDPPHAGDDATTSKKASRALNRRLRVTGPLVGEIKGAGGIRRFTRRARPAGDFEHQPTGRTRTLSQPCWRARVEP